MQLLEIYNEQLRDLLDDSRSHARLDIRNTERSGLNVPDAIQVCCPTHLHAQSLHVSVELCCSVHLPLQLRQLSMTLPSIACLMYVLQDVLV